MRIVKCGVVACLTGMVGVLGGCAAGSSTDGQQQARAQAQAQTQPQARRPTWEQRRARFAEHTAELLGEFDTSSAQIDLDKMFSPGVPKDGIEAISDPKMIPVGSAEFPPDDGRVIATTINGRAIAYPLAILSVHEMVNDTAAGRRIAVSYCPLCDSAAVYDRRLPNGRTAEFGISGMLYKSNLTYYDRASHSLWSQVDMRALTGPFAGQSLDHLPFEVMTFQRFKHEYPSGMVMSTDTGHDVEQYKSSHYESYFASDRLYMPVEYDQSLPAKLLGMGVNVGGQKYFVTQRRAQQSDVRIQTARGAVVVSATADGMQLKNAPDDVDAMQTFWFAWSSVNPDTNVIDVKQHDRGESKG